MPASDSPLTTVTALRASHAGCETRPEEHRLILLYLFLFEATFPERKQVLWNQEQTMSQAQESCLQLKSQTLQQVQ